MKTSKILFVMVAAALSAGCGGGSNCGPFAQPEISSVEVSLSDADGTGSVSSLSDLRLGITLDIRYVTQRVFTLPGITAAYACSPAPPSGVSNEIGRLSLSCDKPVRGFAAGENILTTTSKVRPAEGREGNGLESITLGQWLELVNDGSTCIDGREHYDYDLPGWGSPYDVSIEFVPEGTPAAAGKYTFTLTIERERAGTYEKTFAPVTVNP